MCIRDRAWTEPHYFNLNGQAGAPPDDFSVNGQNWGFPTYNWDVMEKDGYASVSYTHLDVYKRQVSNRRSTERGFKQII